jgi:soluble lytic murein transglycosylase-like protein
MESEPPRTSRGVRSIRWILLSFVTLLITLFPLKVIHEEPGPCSSVSRKARVRVVRIPQPETEVTPVPVHPRKRERHFHPIILAASNKHRVDPALVKAIIMAESSYNPTAISKKGAVGLMQLMPITADAMGVEDSLDPEHNINGGVRYLKHLLNIFSGDLTLAIAAYNAGITTVKKYQGVPPFKATQYYVKKVFEYYQQYKNTV